MPLDFPPSPAVNEIYTFGGRYWIWNGTAWDSYSPVTTITTLNGLTGTVGITAGSGMGVTVSGQNIVLNNTGVLSFNGLTGAVTGVTTGNANTFGPVQSFNGGIVASGATLTGNVYITGLGTPSVDSQAANKAYVDSVASVGIHYHTAVALASTDSETFNTGVTYDNGASGVGATLRKTASFARINIDSTDGSTGDRILIRSAATQQWNGVYSVTNQGSGSTGWILTRTTDADNYHPYENDGLGGNDYFFVTGGSSLKNNAYICSNAGGITFGTTAITFAIFSTPPVYTAGTGLALNSLQFSNTGVLSFNGSTGSITGVSSVRGLTGAVGITNGSGIGLSVSGQTMTFSNTGVLSFNGLTGAVTGVSSVSGLTGAIGITNGSGIGLSVSGQTMTFSNTGVLSIDGGTGAITNVARTNVNNNFSANQTISLPFGQLIVVNTILGVTANYSANNIQYYSGSNSQTITSSPSNPSNNITLPNFSTTLAGLAGTQTFTGTNTFNTLTNFPGGISAAGGTFSGTQTFVNGATFQGNINAPNIVTSFNGLTGAVTGVTTGSANTFGPLQSFTNGISAAGGTFSSQTRFLSGIAVAGGATFATDISVNGMRVGLGAGNQASNVAIGPSALSGSGNTGTDNIAIGINALGNNTSGTNNLAIGSYSMYSNTTGANNTSIGSYVLYYNTTASENTGVGESALFGSVLGSTTLTKNVAVGRQALFGSFLTNTDFANSTAVGYGAGRYFGSGTNALASTTGGIYIGYLARGSANAQTNEIVIGTDALGLGSNTAVIGATSQTAATIYGLLNAPGGISAAGATFSSLARFNAGISAAGGTFSSQARFLSGITVAGGATFATDISVNGMRVGLGAGNQLYNVALGAFTLTTNTIGNYNLAIGSGSLQQNLDGTDNIALGYGSLNLNSSGSNNVGVGSSTLFSNNTGFNNSAIGVASLGNISTGNDNVGIGSYSLGAISSGRSQNTAIGSLAGYYRGSTSNTLLGATGGIYIGYQSRASANAQTNEIVIGTQALGLGSNTAVIGATSQTAATIYGLLNATSGISAPGGTFSALTRFTSGISAAGGTFSGTQTFVNGATFSSGINVTGNVTATGALIGYQQINAQTGTTYTAVLSDVSKLITLNNASGITMTIPLNSSVAFPTGTVLYFAQLGVGQVGFTGASGVTLNFTPGRFLRTQYSTASAIQLSTNIWLLSGDLTA